MQCENPTKLVTHYNFHYYWVLYYVAKIIMIMEIITDSTKISCPLLKSQNLRQRKDSTIDKKTDYKEKIVL